MNSSYFVDQNYWELIVNGEADNLKKRKINKDIRIISVSEDQIICEKKGKIKTFSTLN